MYWPEIWLSKAIEVPALMDQNGVSSFKLARFNRDFGPIRLDTTYGIVALAHLALGDAYAAAHHRQQALVTSKTLQPLFSRLAALR